MIVFNTGASFVPVIVIVKFWVSVAFASSVTVTGIVIIWLTPAAKLWYATSAASNVYVPFEFSVNPATVEVVVYTAVAFASTSLEVIVPLNTESSSLTVTAVIVSNTGASFTGFTVTVIVWTVVNNPSVIVKTISAAPLKFAFGVKRICPASVITAVPFVAVTVAVKASLFASVAI